MLTRLLTLKPRTAEGLAGILIIRVGFYPGKTGFAQPTGKNWVKLSLNRVKPG